MWTTSCGCSNTLTRLVMSGERVGILTSAEPASISMDGPPVASRFCTDPLGPLQTSIRRHPINRGAQMGNPLAPASTAGRPLRASIIVRLLARRSDLCVSCLRRLANSGAGLQKVARYGSPVRSTAQIVRAFLLATATVARLKPRRSRSWLTH
jgi:hypothetical protein